MRRALLGAALVLALAACYDLTVPDGSGLTREQFFRNPQNIELGAASTFVSLWACMTNGNPSAAMSVMGEEVTTSNDVWDMFAMGQEPREPFDNTADSPVNDVALDPWRQCYEANAGASDMIRAIHTGGYKIINKTTGVDETNRTVTFARFVHAASHLYTGIVFDSSWVFPEDFNLADIPADVTTNPAYRFHGYKEVMDSGAKWMKQAITDADTAGFTLPQTDVLWIFGVQMTAPAFARVLRSILARSMVYAARNPTERAAVDWPAVKGLIDAGITEDFAPGGPGSRSIRPDIILNYGYWQAVTSDHLFNAAGVPQTSTTRTLAHRVGVDMRLVGPGDTTGAYQGWLAKVDGSVPGSGGRDSVRPVILGSPDKRIQQGGSIGVPTNGTRFSMQPFFPPDTRNDGMPAERGRYYQSFYYSLFRTGAGNNTIPPIGLLAGSGLSSLKWDAITVTEMDLLKAEAEYRLGNMQAAADLISKTRVTNGGLPAVTVTGPPPGPSCVPRTYDGSCGDLWDALVYEKRVELYGRDGLIPYADLRGWGCLLEGTMVQFPVPAKQLNMMNKPNYTYGGAVGTSGGAPKPDAQKCRILVRPDRKVS